ncbi:MAG: hypothetical protein PHS41_06250 [Victivallaceae bacterium]|nr:hypothetical protein [Victivallaceae bacterium]
MHFIAKITVMLTAFATGIVLFGQAAFPEQEQTEPVPVAPKVQSVVDELTRFFASSDTTPKRSRIQRPEEAPYCKVIPGPDQCSTLVYRCRYSPSKQIYTAIESLLSNAGVAEYVKEHNLIMIYDHNDRIRSIKETLIAMDVPSPQILIEAKIVEVTRSDGMQRSLTMTFANNNGTAGFQTSVPGQSSSSTDGAKMSWTANLGSDNNLNIALRWLLTAEDAKILSSPNIVVSRNQKSSISTGQDIPIQEATTVSSGISISTKFRRVGVSLEVEPVLINGNQVTLRVLPQVSNVLRYETIQQGTGTSATTYPVPVISIRNVETNLRMLDRQVVMMGGLYTNTNSVQQQRIPFLSDIPVLGEVFTSKYSISEVVQLIFFLKVHILSPEEVADGFLYDTDEIARSSNFIGDSVVNSKLMPIHQTTTESLKKEVLTSPVLSRIRHESELRKEAAGQKKAAGQEEAQKPSDAAPQKASSGEGQERSK